MESESEAMQDSIIVKEQQLEQLEEENQALQAENEKLRTKFDEAMKLTQGVDNLHQANKDLSNKLHQAQSENAELKNRLDIALKKIDGLTKKMEEDKKAAQEHTINANTASQKELKKVQSEAQSQIEELYNQIEALESSKQENDVNLKMQAQSINRLLASASRFFEAEVNKLDDLTDILESGVSVDAAAKPEQSQQAIPKSKQDQEDKQAKKNKRLLRQALKAQEVLEKQLTEAKRALTDSENRHSREIQDIQSQIRREKDEHEMADAEKQHYISGLESKIETLKSEIAKLRTKPVAKPANPPSAPKPQEKPKPEIQSQTQKVKEATERAELRMANEQYLQRNAELANQNQALLDKIDTLTVELHNANEANQQAAMAVEKSKDQYNSLQLVHQQAKEEIAMMRAALHAKQEQKTTDAIAQERKQRAELKAKILNLEKANEAQQRQLRELNVEVEQYKAQQAAFASRSKEVENQVADVNKKLAQAQEDLQTARRQAEERPPADPEELLPSYIWSCPEFGSELSAEVTKIASNSSLQPVSKLQSIYQAINKHYRKEIEGRDSALDEAYTDNQTIRQRFNAFLIDLTIGLGINPPVNFDSFFQEDGEAAIMQGVAHINQVLDDLSHHTQIADRVFSLLAESFNFSQESTDENSLCQQIIDLKQRFDTANSRVANQSKKLKDLKRNLSQVVKKTTESMEDAQAKIGQLSEDKEELTKQNEELISSNQSLKKTLQAAKLDSQDREEEHEEQLKQLSEEYEEKIEDLQRKANKTESELRQELELAIEHGNSVTDSLAESEAAIVRMKKTMQNQKSAIADRDAQIEQLREENEHQLQSLQERHESEKANLVETYEKAVAEITQQCDAHRQDVERLSAEIANNEKTIKKMKASSLQNKRETMKKEMEMKKTIENIEREKQLAETAAHNKMLENEAEYSQKLNEQKAQSENELRRVLSYFANEFNQFFNASEALTESSYKIMVKKAHDEMARLTKSDSAIRKMTNAPPSQRTDEVVAQLLLSQ